MTFEDIRNLFERANQQFLHEGYHAVANNVSERNWYGTMKSCLDRAKSFTAAANYFTDIEYNRNGGRLKTIMDDANEIISICCDVILHSRGQIIDQDNLIAIEMKKSGRPVDERKNDINRLRCLTRQSFNQTWSFDGTTLPQHVCRYQLGVFYEIDTATYSGSVTYFRNGDPFFEYAVNFNDGLPTS